jgi:hypothetical protein
MFYSPFRRFLVEEDTKLEAISHLPHIGELLYTGNPNNTIKHLEATHEMLKGNRQQGHNLSYKADGKVSIVFGKRNGNPFVKYKGSGSPELYSEDQIHSHINQTGKMHLLQPFLYGLKAAQHSNIKHNHSYQGDVMVPAEDSPHLMGNIIKYNKPHHSVSHAIAVHTHIDTGTGKKIASNPDVSFLETPGTHFPKLDLSTKKFNISPDESKHISHHIEQAKKILSDADVAYVANEIGQHRDPTNKTGHRHLHMVSFSNKVQAGKQKRDIGSLMNWTKEGIDATKGKQQERIKGHLDYIHRNRHAITKLLAAHDHIDAARSKMVDIIHKDPNLPMTPQGGHSEGEGFVSELPDIGQVKLVPTSFTERNNLNKERFKK